MEMSELYLDDIKREKLEELQKLASDLNLRNDPEYLYRYLAGHKYDVSLALKALKNYESFVNRRQERWLKFKRSKLENVFKAQIVDVLQENGIYNQKIVWIRIEQWNPIITSADQVLEASGLLCELIYQIVLTVNAIDVIVDLHNFSLRHLYALSTKFAKRMVFFMAECLPMEVRNVYVVRQPKIFYILYSLFKQFLGEKIRKMICVCGYDFSALFNNIGGTALPSEFGGISPRPPQGRWMHLLEKDKTIIGKICNLILKKS